ncbi:MAG: choice-of-anchor D domain-containing protein [Thermomicrobiales bacterium]
MQRMRKFLHLAVIFSMLMTLAAVAFPATVGAANLSVTPQSHDFGAVEIGTTSPSTEFTINNTGNVAFTVVNVGSNDPAWFQVTANGCLAAVLLVGQSCVFSVVFTPPFASDFNGNIGIDIAGPGAPPDTSVTVSGHGVNPVVAYDPPAPHDFGNVQIGSTSVQQVITVTNNGDEEIQFTSAVFSTNPTEFVVETTGSSGQACLLNITLAPGSSCSVRVTFQPANGAPGPRNGGLAFQYLVDPISNAGPPGGFVTTSYALQGTAVLGTLAANPNPVDFGNVLAGPPTAAKTVTLTNTGTGPLRLNGTSIQGANSGMFETIVGSDNCSNTTLAANGLPGDSCTVEVRFNSGGAASATPKSAVLRFDVQSGANGPYPAQKFDVPLMANVVSGIISVDPTSWDFGSKEIGTYTAPKTFTVTNNSTGPITITDLNETGQTAQFDLLMGAATARPSRPAPAPSQVALCRSVRPGHEERQRLHRPQRQQLQCRGESHRPRARPDPRVQRRRPVELPDTQVGTASMPMQVTPTNNGSGPLNVFTVTAAAATEFDVVGDLCSADTTPAAGTRTFWVVFSPTAIGNVLGSITVSHNGNADPLIIQLQGNAVAGSIAVSGASVNFGGVEINTTSMAQTVTNNSTGPITITDLNETGQTNQFDLLDGSCELATLQGGQTCTFQVAFKPVGQPGQKNASVFIVHTGSNDSVEVNLTGYADEVQLTITPAGTYNFGDVVVGQTAVAVFTVTNPSATSHTFAGITAGPAPFSILADNCSPTLGSHQSCTVVVQFAPTAVGPAVGTLQVNPIVVLNGNGVSPNGALQVSTPQLSFGPQQIGSESQTQALIVSNNGNVPVHIDTISISGDDYIVQTGLGATCQVGLTLDPGVSCILWVAFAPNGPPGNINELLTITYDSAAVNPGNLIVALRGTATTPNGMVSPLQLDFGAQEINTTSGPQTVTFTNTGGDVIVVPPVTLAGPNANQYLIQSDACSGASVLAGATCTISVVFRPTSAGSKNAQLAVGALPNSDVVTLKGVGVNPLLVVAPAGPVDFGDVIVDGAGGNYSLRSFTITNTGSNPAAVPAPTFTNDFSLETWDCVGPLNPLGPGASCTVVVRFDPLSVGEHNGTMTLNPIVVFSGTGVAANGALSVSPPQLTFAPQQIGTQSGTQQIIVSNNGNVPVTIDGAAVVGANYVLANGAGNTCQTGVILGVGESCSLWVAFQPVAPPGAKNAQVNISYHSAAVAAGVVSVLLRGNAITPNGTVSPLQLDFGFQEVGTMSSPQTVTFTNTGTEIIVIPVVSVTPAGQFAIQSDSCSGASVLPGATCTISVTFLPTVAGSHEASLTVGALPNQSVVTLKGVGVDATISITPLDYNFGYVVVGQTAIHAFTVTNNGSDPVTIPGTLFAGDPSFSQLSEDCSILNPLGPGASCTIVVQFAPTSIGPKNGTFTVNPVVTLHGTGVAPSGALAVSPVQLSFGNVQIGSMSATQTITFSNNGSLPVTLTSLPGLNGPNSGDFLLTVAGNTCQIGVALNPGESCVVSVAFRPTAAGNREAWVTLTYTSASVPNGVISVLLRGVGITPVISVSPNQLIFGNQTLNTASASKTVVVTNSSNGPVTLGILGTGGTNPGDFQIVGDTCSSATLAAGTTCTFSVVFLPTSGTGPKNATVVIPVLGLSNVVVNLSGQALAAQQGNLTFSPAFVNFGYVQVGSPTLPVPVTITNNGNAVMTVNNIAILGPQFLDFNPLIGDDCEGKSLNPGQSCTVYVRFRPFNTGVREAILTYFTDLAGSPHAVYLYGVGISPVLTISPVQLNFGNLQAGSVSAPYTVTVTNSSNGPITLDVVGPYTGDFELVGALCDNMTLAPNGTCTLSVTFRPQSTGTQTDAVDINITPGGLNFEVDLVGVGLTPNGMISPLQLDFGNIQVGTTSMVQTVTFTNTGTGPINVPPIDLAGPNAGDFLIQTDGCSNAVVPAGGWCQVSVVARPQVQGPRNAQLKIDPLHNTDVVTLKVNGQVPSPQLRRRRRGLRSPAADG